MNICTLYKNLKERRKLHKQNKDKIACIFVPLHGEPWMELLKSNRDGFATNKNGTHIFIDKLSNQHIYGEFPARKVDFRDKSTKN
jgi:hypothetical protein